MGQIIFLLSNQQCQSTERNTKHWTQQMAWPHPFIHSPMESSCKTGIAPFTYQYQNYYWPAYT